MNKGLKLKMMKAKCQAIQQIKLIQEIDADMERLGYNIELMRNDDECNYVDMIDYGVGVFNLNEAEKYKQKKGVLNVKK